MDLPAEGRCLCGALRYRVTEEPTNVAYCDCRMCQRRRGAPMVTTLDVPVDGFAFIQGELAACQSSPAAHRVFCRDCSTEIYFSQTDDPTGRSLNLGTLDDPEAVQPRMHIWTDSQLSWFNINDDLPRHGKYPSQDED